MKIAGISEKSVSPTGGRIEKAGAKPNGVFIDAAGELITKFIPAPLPLERDIALARAQDYLLSLGITAIADMGTSVEDWLTFRRAGDAGLPGGEGTGAGAAEPRPGGAMPSNGPTRRPVRAIRPIRSGVRRATSPTPAR